MSEVILVVVVSLSSLSGTFMVFKILDSIYISSGQIM